MASTSVSSARATRTGAAVLAALLVIAWALAGASPARAGGFHDDAPGLPGVGLPAKKGVERLTANAAEADYDVLVFSRTTGFRHETAIQAGHAEIAEMGTEQNFSVTASEDSTLFTDAGLRPYEVIVFLNIDGEGHFTTAQRTAFERWLQRGRGLVRIHAAANADRNWAWMGDMNGDAWFLNHPSGALQFQDADVLVEDATHPSTQGLPAVWNREDEWYNFTAEPRGKVHVLLKVDENTYEEQDGTPEADDHPIAWCSDYDGGRTFYTAMGHHGTYWAEELYQAHIYGAINWASGRAAGDCGEDREGIPTDAAFDKITLDDTTENPMEIAVAEDGDVYYVELAGRVKHYDRQANTVRAIGMIPVHRGNENGLLGITLDPEFETNRHLYLFYSAPSPEIQRISRFTLAANGDLDMASERPLLEFPHQRIVCCHSSGSMTFGPDGNLYIATGDDTEHAASSGYNPIDDDVLRNNPGDNPDADRAYDARRSSGNTNDLRGKILRIRPKPDPTGTPGPGNTYDIPAGNLFGLGGRYPGVEGQTRPEIYTMGHRNPFRIQVDSETGWLYNGEVGPDANSENANRGPRGYDELNQIRQAGNMGWPYCIADNKAYRDWTFPSGPAGAAFDCSGQEGGGPVNTSNYNTGIGQTPPTTGALLWWPYSPYPSGFPWGAAPTAIPTGPGRTAIAGPIYHFNAESESETKFPQYYDDKVFFGDWSRDWIATLTLDAEGNPAAIEEFMPGADFRHPHDLEMGADGNLYVLEWGRDFNYAGAGINPDSGLYRIEFAKGARTPVARASSDKDSGPAPLTVAFSSEGTEDADGDELTFEWNFDDGTPVSTEANPTHTFTEPGTYNVRLTATDSTGKAGSSTVVINVGNTRPQVTIDVPQGGVFDWGDEIPYTITVTDPEDGTIDCNRVTLNPGIFHDEGGNAHVHPGTNQTGCTGTVDAPAESGHAKSANIALVLVAAYTDTGGQPGSSPLEGGITRRLTPKTIQAEHYTEAHPGTQLNNRPAAEGGFRVGFNDAGEWIYFDPVSLHQVDEVTVRYTSGGEGGIVDFRLDAPDGPVVGTVELPNNGGWDNYSEVTAPITPTDSAPHKLYLAYRALPGQDDNDLFDLDELRFGGKGVASNSAPTADVGADPTSGSVPLLVNFTANAEDPDGDDITYAWDFESDGTVDATTENATHTYTEPDVYTATLRVTDEGGRSRTETVTIEAFEPIGACPGDDDFVDAELDREMWSVVRENAADLTVADGGLTIQARPGDIFGGGTTMENIVLQDLPDSGPWTATTRLSWNPSANFQNAGIKIYDSDANWIKFGMVWNAGRKFEFYKETNNSPANLNTTPTLPGTFPTTFQLRLVSDGTNITAQYSPNGEEWTNMGTAATNLSGFTNPRIGMYATSTNQPSIPARFDWFRLDTPVDPTDQFDGDALDECRWTQIVREDEEDYRVSDGALEIDAGTGDMFGNAENAENLIMQPAPEGEWTVETQMTYDAAANYQQAGMMLYGDDDNYAKFGLLYASGRMLEYVWEQDNVPRRDPSQDVMPVAADFPSTVRMRLSSDGTNVTASFFDGDAWQPLGRPVPLAEIPDPHIGLFAFRAGAGAPENTATFDYFRTVAADVTAPVTTADTEEQPDGSVRVTLSATDEDGGSGVARTEYRLDDGEWTEYSAPFDVSAPGEHTVEYRSVDEAGNEEAIKSVSFTVEEPGEPGAPTVQGFADPSSGPAPLRVRFSATGVDPDGGPVAYRWEYEDGTVIGSSFTYTFREPGEHTATVTVTDDEGDTASDEVTVTVGGTANQAPTVDASVDLTSGPAPLRVRFDAVGDDPDGPEGGLTYAWEFDDGGTSMVRRPRHTYLEPGEYTATVTVTDAGGATGSDTVTVTVSDPPANRPPSVQAGALPASGNAPLEVLFTAAGTDPDDDPVSYEWDFGDGSDPVEGRRARHTYSAAGTYTATVTASDPDGATGTAEVEVVVGDPPGNQAPSVQAGADPNGGAAPLTVRFTSAGSDPDGDALLYVWSFGDGGQAGGRNATHTYTAPGTYTATVTVTDPDGATGTDSVQVTVTGTQAFAAPAPATIAPAPDAARIAASAARPASMAAFRKRGVRVTVRCASTASGRASLRVSNATAKRLRLARRTIASRALRCAAGREVALRLKPSRSTGRRLAGVRRLRTTLRLALAGTRGVEQRLTIGSRRS
jgi:cytochrome c